MRDKYQRQQHSDDEGMHNKMPMLPPDANSELGYEDDENDLDDEDGDDELAD